MPRFKVPDAVMQAGAGLGAGAHGALQRAGTLGSSHFMSLRRASTCSALVKPASGAAPAPEVKATEVDQAQAWAEEPVKAAEPVKVAAVRVEVWRSNFTDRRPTSSSRHSERYSAKGRTQQFVMEQLDQSPFWVFKVYRLFPLLERLHFLDHISRLAYPSAYIIYACVQLAQIEFGIPTHRTLRQFDCYTGRL